MTSFYAGQRPDAALLEQLIPLFVRKGTDESVTSNATVQADDELTIPSIPPGIWEFHGQLWVAGASGTNQDVKIAFAFPTGVFSWAGSGFHPNWNNVDGSRDFHAGGELEVTTSVASSEGFGTVTGDNVPITLTGLLENTASGDLTLHWAQNTSNATATTMKAGSWLLLRRAVIE